MEINLYSFNRNNTVTSLIGMAKTDYRWCKIVVGEKTGERKVIEKNNW